MVPFRRSLAALVFTLTSICQAADPSAGNDNVIAVADAITVFPAKQLAGNDSDSTGAPLLVTAVSGASVGTVALVDGNIIYTAPPGYTGLATFAYTVRSGAKVSAPFAQGAALGFANVAHSLTIHDDVTGSSLAAVPGTTDEYYMMSDRGPNGDNSGVPAGSPALTDPNAKIFPIPAYAPNIARVRWNSDGSTTLIATIKLKDAAGNPLTGLAPHLNATGAQIIDTAYDIVGNPLAADPNGIDSEGLAALPDGTFWVSDEYGPCIVHFAADGKTLERLSPFAANAQGHKLPAVLAKRLTNKGMEGLTITPDGSLLVGLMQSALVNDDVNDPIGNPYVTGAANTYGKNSKKNLFLRLVTYRLVAGAGEAIGTVHQYAYILGAPAATGNASGSQAMSEITAISNTDMLIDERDGNFPSAGAVKKSWVCHLPSGLATDATPIDDITDSDTGLKSGGATLETIAYNKNGAPAAAAFLGIGIKVLPKDAAPLVDLALVGLPFDHDKVEGVIDVGGQVTYSNDSDYSLNGSVTKVIPGSYAIGLYPLGTPADRTIDYTQLLQVDPARITLSATATVTLAVNANTAPTINAVAPQATFQDTPTDIAVTIGDSEGPIAGLKLSATSDNAELVPDANIVISTVGTHRTVTITPTANLVGDAIITLTVSDGLLSTSTTFDLVVNDHAPVAGSASMSAVKNAITVVPAQPITASVSDVDGDALLITAVSPVSSHGATVALVDGRIIYTPPAGFTGADSFTYTVRDGAKVSAPLPLGVALGFGNTTHTLTINDSVTGSSLAAVPGVANEYYLMSDRGPNGDNSGVPATSAALADPNAKIFPLPQYAPNIARVRWNADGTVTLVSVIKLQDAAGNTLTGLAPHLNSATVPVPADAHIIDTAYDLVGNPLAADPNGIDSEGLVAAADGTFWVSDEYGPYLVHFDATGKTIERVSPLAANGLGHKLPAVLGHRLTNKGMEGLCITPDGALLVGMMQSALVNDPVNDPIGNPYVTGAANTYGKNNKKNLLTRLVTYRLIAGGGDPVGTVHQYAYLMGDPAATGTAASNAQAISEVAAISNTEILVDERDGNFPSASSGANKKSWVCVLPSGQASDATPIDDGGDTQTGLTFTGTTLETLTYNKAGAPAAAALSGVGITVLPKKSAPLIDLAKTGLAFDHDKVEGMLADVAHHQVLYSNDSDYAINGSAPKGIPGSYPVGVFPTTTAPGSVLDYSQLLTIDPDRLQSTVGTVNVTVVGDIAPTIGTVANQVTLPGVATTPIAITIGDAETPATYLVLSASSSNPALVPASGLTLGGTGANRSLVITPVAGLVAATTITLTVDDTTGQTTTLTFIYSTDQAPIANNGTLSATAGVTALGQLSATDPDGNAVTYRVATAPTKGSVGVIVATGAYGYIPNASATGTDTFTFKANDGSFDSNAGTITITIAPNPSAGSTTGTSTAGTSTAGTTTVGTTGAVSTGSSDDSKNCGLGSGLAALISLLVGLRAVTKSRPRKA